MSKNELLDHPDFQARLLESLCAQPLEIRPSNSSVHLLRLAFAGHSHLNWVAFTNLSYEGVATALESEELRDANALSLCIDDLSGSPNALFDALSRSQTLSEACFLENPTQGSDDLTSRVFAQFCASPSASSLLKTKKMFFTCAYSAPLRKRLWLPSPNSYDELSSKLPVSAFPVQYMFVRQQFVSLGLTDIKFRPNYFFLGDALLTPERFVSGFLQYCRSVLTDRYLVSFAGCPSDLLFSKINYPGITISPILAQNLAVPGKCTVITGKSEISVDLWPMTGEIEKDGWVVLVSHEWYTDPEANSAPVPFIRYAFVRARQLIETAAVSDHLLQGIVGPDYVDIIGGVKGFLRETAPQVDTNLVDRPFNETLQILEKRWPTSLGPGMSYVSILDDSEALSILRDFIQDAVFVRENLRLAIQQNPEGISSLYPF